jgi:hypothetical protein
VTWLIIAHFLGGQTMKLRIILGAVALSAFASTPALAVSFESLVGDGYKVSKMSRNAAGMSGWNVSKGDSKYFCKLDATQALTKTTVVSLITGGRTINMDRKTFESRVSTEGMPQMADLKAGKPRPQDVGSCSKQK